MIKVKLYLNMLVELFLLSSLLSLCLVQLTYAKTEFFSAPDSRDWPNPYKMLKAKKINGNKGWKWEVFAAYKGAPLERGNGSLVGKEGSAHALDDVRPADFLEGFSVINHMVTKLQVRSMVDQRVGWMDMRDLLVFARPIRTLRDITLKAFLRIDLGRRGMDIVQGEERGIDLLRFRDGPGIPGHGNDYKYLISQNDVNQVSSLFLYIYAVHFSNDKQMTIAEMKEDIDNYFELYNNLDNVDYVLLGTSLSFNAEDLPTGEIIRGWLPAAAVQYWGTRQAVEAVPGTPAHLFKNKTDLLKYFDLASQQRQAFFHELEVEGKVQRATGEAINLRGQDMRYLVLERSTQPIHTVLAGVSDIAQRDGEQSTSQDEPTIREQRSQLNQTLARAQLASTYLDLFFLVDGTTSMEGPVESAAKVIENLLEQTRSMRDVKVSIRAGVFRDQSDTTNPVFEDWDSRWGRPADWLRILLKEGRICSGTDEDFDESLLYGIRSAIRAWKPHFKHPNSLRVMFVLGDAGDNSKALETAMAATRNSVNGEDIHILPIHFNHPLKDDSNKQLGPLSQLSAICEEEQWRIRISDMYESSYAAEKAMDKYKSSFERIAMCNFIEQMAELAKIDSDMVRSLADNIDFVLAELTREYLSGSLNMVRVLQKVRQGRFTIKEAEEEMGLHGDIAMGIFQHRIRQMKQHMPELSKMLEQRPDLAYSELFIAEEDGNRQLLRPVLLISQRELGKIVSSMTNFIQQYRQCTQETYKRLVAESLTTLLGEVLQLDPDLVTDNDMENWTKIAVDRETSYLGAPKLIEEYCKDNEKWVRFLARLQQAEGSLKPLLADPEHPRRFADISGVIYYWLYPEELFPLPEGGL